MDDQEVTTMDTDTMSPVERAAHVNRDRRVREARINHHWRLQKLHEDFCQEMEEIQDRFEKEFKAVANPPKLLKTKWGVLFC